MKFGRFLDRDAVAAAFKELGFETAQEATRFRSVDQLYRHLLKQSGGDGTGPNFKGLPQRHMKARHLARKLEGAGRDLVGLHDPATAMLRHLDAPSIRSPLSGDVLDDSSVRYVRPDSIQSSQSPAAYLAYLYNLAKDEITASLEVFALDKRRPDLAKLVLSRDNLDQEITTLRLVNEILTEQLIDNEVADDEASLLAALKTTRHPFAMPFDKDNATVREALAAMGGLSLNMIANRGRQDGFALGQEDFTLVPNPAHRLRLYDDHGALLVERPDAETLYGTWFGLCDPSDPDSANADLQFADAFAAASGLSFQEFRALVGDDATAVDESGTRHWNISFRFLAKGWFMHLSRQQDGRYKTRGSTLDNSNARNLPWYVHEMQNKCVRLQQRTGLAFHEVNRLLLTAVYGHPSFEFDDELDGGETTIQDEVLRDGTGLDLLAHYVEWSDWYDLNVDRFNALVGDINCIHRLGSGETSLMRELFGADAPEITLRTRRWDQNSAIKIGEVDGDGEEGHLGAILRRGFKLSRAEWDVIVSEVSESADDTLDSVMMGCIYRLSHLFRLMGWGVLGGIELMRKVDPALLETLARSNNCADVLRALDKVSWLSDWMDEAELTPAEVMTVLTAPADATLYANQDILNWVFELQQTLQGALVTAPEFSPYTQWRKSGGDNGDIVEIKESEWVEGLQEAGVLDDEDRGLMITGERHAVAAATIRILETRSIDLDDDEQSERAEELIDRLVARQAEQTSILAAQIAKQGGSLSEGAVPPLLRWMDSRPYETLSVFVDWDTDDDPGNEEGLNLLFDIQRHALVVDKIGMDVPEVEMAADRPSWIAHDMGSPLALKQVYLLSRFRTLQNPQISANDWLAYFAAAEASGDDETENHARLSRLLGWPAGEIALLAVGPDIGIENGRIVTVEQADFVARRIALCQDAALGANELVAIESANGDDPDWAAARAAALIGLGRFEDGAHAAAAEGRVDEELRDALVGLYMTRVAAADGELREHVTTDENLYEYLLLDVNVSREVPTTRMLEAIGSLQLYINRALENIEDAEFEDKAAFAEQWETEQQYRLWEANEKLALYPSNFIEPELRQGKTELFQSLERSLSQGEINEDTVEKGVHSYVAGLQRLSELRPHGFFFTRNMANAVYYFTARASWEKHGYYYRKLDMDRLRLGDGSPHAFSWGDWRRADLPIAADHVYGVVPGFAWNRLFLFWFEMEEEVVRDGDNDTTTHYRLRPKYSRQNLDGRFTDPWSPALGEDVDLDVTALVGPEGPESYKPLIYQPYLDRNEEQLILYFVTNEEREPAYSWMLSGSTSRNYISRTTVGLPDPDSLPGYDSVPHGLKAISTPWPIIYPDIHEDIEFDLGGFVHIWNYEWKLRLEIDRSTQSEASGNSGTSAYGWFLVYNWSANRAVFHGVDEPNRQASLENLDAVVRMNGIEVSRSVISPPLPPSYSGEIELPFIEVSVPFGAGQPTLGIVDVTVEATCRVVYWGNESITEKEASFQSLYILEDYESHLFYGSQGSQREAEHYLLSEDEAIGTIVSSLFSSGVQAISSLVYPGYNIRQLFSLDNQQPREEGVSHFLEQVEASYGEVQKPRPRTRLDFDGPYGLYAWELFFHIPLIIAARYGAAGKFEEARRWLHTIYNPQTEAGEQWGVWPLLPQNSGHSYTVTVTDPDRIAVEEPAHYRLASIRHYLRTITDQGDVHYRRATTESLRQAKMWYISAKNLFLDVAGDTFAQSTREDWREPTLGAVGPEAFRPPYNDEMRSAYELLEQRLDNLRNWRSIDGEPLTVPLVAAAVSPRQLQMAALSGTAASEVAASSQTALRYSFDTALVKAKEAVNNLMYFGDLLTRGLYRQDELALEELHARQAHHIASNLEEAGQDSLIQSMQKERKVLEKEKEEAQQYLEWRTRFAEEYMNVGEIEGMALLTAKSARHVVTTGSAMVAGSLKLVPTIFGFSVGGTKPEGIAEAAAYAMEQSSEALGTLADIVMLAGASTRRQQENEMERDATQKVVERINAAITRIDYDIKEEQGTLEELKIKTANAEGLIEFHRRRVTNREFRNWYVGRIASLHDSAYDITLRFCRLAERAYQAELGDPTASFIRPAWDAQHRGLLAGQSLMLDLQRMDFAHMERYEPEAEGRLSVALGDLDPVALEALKSTGRALFTIGEEQFDEEMPDEYERRIKSVQVRLRGIGERAPVGGRLLLLGHRTYLDPDKSEDRSILNVFGHQQITIAGIETDTSAMSRKAGRFLPFERCGVASTWMLSFPAAVKALAEKRRRSRHRTLLEKLEDVVFEIHYTARVGK